MTLHLIDIECMSFIILSAAERGKFLKDVSLLMPKLASLYVLLSTICAYIFSLHKRGVITRFNHCDFHPI